jgi:hypothetical protein
MPAIIEVRKDSVVRLARAVNAKGTVVLDEHLWIIPTKISSTAVQTHFLARRRTTTIIRSAAVQAEPPPLSIPDLVPAFGNLSLKLRLESVMIRERESENHLDHIVLTVLEILPRRAVVSLTIPSGMIMDLTQLNNEQERTVGEILDKLNYGDTRVRVDDL